MSDPLPISVVEQLRQFQNEKGVIEIAIRGKNKRFKAFQKIMIQNLPETQEKELAQKVIRTISKNNQLNERTLSLMTGVARLEGIGLLLNGLNLCATCGGFAIMYSKLDKMSIEINQQLSQLQRTVKQTQDIQNNYEFNQVLAEHTDMLDSQKRQHPYTEEKMRALVDREHSILLLLIDTIQKDVSSDRGALIFTIFTMLAMFTESLRSFDEIYYFNNRQVLGDNNVWHLSHNRWMEIYDTMSSKWFVEKLQDYASFDTKLSTPEVDIYYISLLDQVADMREEIEDNQALIIAAGDIELFRAFKELTTKEIIESIEDTFKEAGIDMDQETVMAAYQNAMQQAAMV